MVAIDPIPTPQYNAAFFTDLGSLVNTAQANDQALADAINNGGGGGGTVTIVKQAITFASGYSMFSTSFQTIALYKIGNLVTLAGGVVDVPAAGIGAWAYNTWATFPVSGWAPAKTVLTNGGLVTNDILGMQMRVTPAGELRYAAAVATNAPDYILVPTITWEVP